MVVPYREVLKISCQMANSIDPVQTAPWRSSLIWVYTVCSGNFVPIFKQIMVILTFIHSFITETYVGIKCVSS